jgi:hypothetical protein
MLTMPAKAPCGEVAQAVAAHAETVRVARLIAELAATTSQVRKKNNDEQPAVSKWRYPTSPCAAGLCAPPSRFVTF